MPPLALTAFSHTARPALVWTPAAARYPTLHSHSTPILIGDPAAALAGDLAAPDPPAGSTAAAVTAAATASRPIFLREPISLLLLGRLPPAPASSRRGDLFGARGRGLLPGCIAEVGGANDLAG